MVGQVYVWVAILQNGIGSAIDAGSRLILALIQKIKEFNQHILGLIHGGIVWRMG